MNVNGIPIAHGMEIEQCSSQVPAEILNDSSDDYFGEWEHDASGPREYPELGASKQVGRLLKKFNHTMRQYSDLRPWSWTNVTRRGNGCGSHAHLSFTQDGCTDEERIEGYTIAYNTTVELAPFLAPFWCHDWEEGFRSSATSRWALPETIRFSQSTMQSNLNNPPRRNYKSVTLSPPSRGDGGKPMTVELRMNEAHPAFALVGLTFLRRTITDVMRDGWSPKIEAGVSEDGTEVSRREALQEVYTAIYNCQNRGGLVEAMKNTTGLRFVEGRGIGGKEEFDNAWEVLQKILATHGTGKGNYDDRVKKLIQAAGDVENGASYGPQNNLDAMWHTTDEEFSWDEGPDVA